MWRGFLFVNKNRSPSAGGVLDASLDQCYVEQKNGQIVRQVVGYDLCWLLGTSVRKIHAFLRTDVPRSQHKWIAS